MATLKAIRHLVILALIVLAGCMSSSPSKTSAVMREMARYDAPVVQVGQYLSQR
ncbi:MAG: hypothetical protein KME07_06820 [Pegethrix bostrychoides GSE-TBD4-15B]|uniref:Uncharacterized protein n=1 Tax=Pegethrix bostrychoides GSE-TBD4-15B TaxID=2839662 RepID=A0A951P984_9CYAN|nr:hypothetical protein [Pegethrix bostrychoides GSE-TBD4-15B]